MGLLDAMSKASEYLPTIRRPERRLSLTRRLAWTGIILAIYLVMSNIPLYGVPVQAAAATSVTLMNIIFASSVGTLMQLGIGPIVTAGLILEVLVGAKLIDIDLTDPEDQVKFTGAMKTLAVIFAVAEALVVTLSGMFWPSGMAVSPLTKALVVIQLVLASYLVILMDEALQKGWGIGSAISLFILAMVAQTVVWDMFGFVPRVALDFGVVPALIYDRNPFIVFTRANGFPDVTGLLATFAIVVLLVYLQAMMVEIPVTSPQLRGIRTKVPLQFLYVTNIPVLLLAILVADLQLFEAPIARFFGLNSLAYRLYNDVVFYLSPPTGLVETALNPLRSIIFAVSWLALSVAFGYVWVEVAGLNPASQAEALVKGGLEIPGMRRNPRVLEGLLSKYIYPLTSLSSLIVGAIAVAAAFLGAYGGGIGLLLAVGIVYQYYSLITYERALEAYPLIKRLLGE
ncbi:MAG: preprotein translocase subunit SecY [Acidilobus sp.]